NLLFRPGTQSRRNTLAHSRLPIHVSRVHTSKQIPPHSYFVIFPWFPSRNSSSPPRTSEWFPLQSRFLQIRPSSFSAVHSPKRLLPLVDSRENNPSIPVEFCSPFHLYYI